jgi:hypothetical protein
MILVTHSRDCLRVVRSMERALDLALPRRLHNQNNVPLSGTERPARERRHHDVDERGTPIRRHDEGTA